MLHKQHVLVFLAALSAAAAQSFEVASVKPAPASGAGGRFSMSGGPGTSDPGRIQYVNVPLRIVLMTAYDVKNFLLTGPDWLNTLRYEITAKIPDGSTKDQFHAMLRELLESRFRLKVHRETKEVPTYALLPGKNGPKLPRAVDGAAGDPADAVVTKAEGRDGFPVVALKGSTIVIESKDGRGRVTAQAVTMAKFADFLANRLGRPVTDATGVSGEYSFALYFALDGPNANDGTEPSIFGAIQEQLGLRLEGRQGPVEFLVVDSAEKTPTGN